MNVFRLRPRISLLSLLLVITCTAMGLAIWCLQQRSSGLQRDFFTIREENRRLVDEYGDYQVEDPSLLYAMQLRRNETDRSGMLDWAWRVTTPPGKTYRLCYAEGTVGRKGLPQPDLNWLLGSGEHRIVLRHRFDPGSPPSGNWCADVMVESSARGGWNAHHTMGATPWPSLATGTPGTAPYYQPDEGVGWGLGASQVHHWHEPDQRLILQRLRVQQVKLPPIPTSGNLDLSGIDKDAASPGFVIWLKPVP